MTKRATAKVYHISDWRRIRARYQCKRSTLRKQLAQPYPSGKRRSMQIFNFRGEQAWWSDDDLVLLFKFAEEDWHRERLADLFNRSVPAVAGMMQRLYDYHRKDIDRSKWSERRKVRAAHDKVRFDEVEWHFYSE